MTKTNAMRLLDAATIEYSTKEYEYDESDLSGHHAAEVLGIPAEQVFKTLVTKGDKTGYIVFCIPVDEELDLKKAASVSGNKKVDMIHVKELLPLTGYIRGGCSPIGMKKKFPTFINIGVPPFHFFSIHEYSPYISSGPTFRLLKRIVPTTVDTDFIRFKYLFSPAVINIPFKAASGKIVEPIFDKSPPRVPPL